MADVADLAQVEIDLHLGTASSAAMRGAERLIRSGHCHNCDEPTNRIGQLFCDKHCALDYEARERLRVLQGL